jgi:hypothetical protein
MLIPFSRLKDHHMQCQNYAEAGLVLKVSFLWC